MFRTLFDGKEEAKSKGRIDHNSEGKRGRKLTETRQEGSSEQKRWKMKIK